MIEIFEMLVIIVKWGNALPRREGNGPKCGEQPLTQQAFRTRGTTDMRLLR